jgi:dipeptide/tripeptide permease
VVSALLAGLMFDSLGPSGLFRVLALGCLIAFVVFGIGRFTLKAEPSSDSA